MPPKKIKNEPKVSESPRTVQNGNKPSDSTTAELDKALVDAKVAYLEKRGNEPSPQDFTLADKLAEELSAAKDPRLFKVLVWMLKKAEAAHDNENSTVGSSSGCSQLALRLLPDS